MQTVKFTFLTGDVDWLTYGGTWVSQKFTDGDFEYWLVREIFNWEEMVGEREAKEVGYTYRCSLSVVSPEEFEDKEGALKFAGWDDKDWDDYSDIEKVWIVYSYGGRAKIWSENGNNYKQLFKQCAAEAGMMVLRHSANMNSPLDEPMNMIGNDGWDFVKGTIGFK